MMVQMYLYYLPMEKSKRAKYGGINNNPVLSLNDVLGYSQAFVYDRDGRRVSNGLYLSLFWMRVIGSLPTSLSSSANQS